MNDFTFTDKGFEEYIYWQTHDRKTCSKINQLLKDIKHNGAMQGTGKPEKLKNSKGYSRRILAKVIMMIKYIYERSPYEPLFLPHHLPFKLSRRTG